MGQEQEGDGEGIIMRKFNGWLEEPHPVCDAPPKAPPL
jgi:hypothetical protein